jgi:hypothetical protein
VANSHRKSLSRNDEHRWADSPSRGATTPIRASTTHILWRRFAESLLVNGAPQRHGAGLLRHVVACLPSPSYRYEIALMPGIEAVIWRFSGAKRISPRTSRADQGCSGSGLCALAANGDSAMTRAINTSRIFEPTFLDSISQGTRGTARSRLRARQFSAMRPTARASCSAAVGDRMEISLAADREEDLSTRTGGRNLRCFEASCYNFFAGDFFTAAVLAFAASPRLAAHMRLLASMMRRRPSALSFRFVFWAGLRQPSGEQELNRAAQCF